MSIHRIPQPASGWSPEPLSRPSQATHSSPPSRIAPTPNREIHPRAGACQRADTAHVGVGDRRVCCVSSSRHGRRGGGRRGVTARLSSIDLQLLVLLNTHRVLTTPQLIALTKRPERTVDYRLTRFRSAGLIDRTRPYAASGSAPFFCG